MAKYLLDTNVISALVRDPHGPVARRVLRAGPNGICTSLIVSAELHYGIEKKGSPRLRAQLESVMQGIEILPLEAPVDTIYGKLRATQERNGKPLGPNDLLIAAHALAADCILVTDNEREFRRVPDLKIENWHVRGPGRS